MYVQIIYCFILLQLPPLHLKMSCLAVEEILKPKHRAKYIFMCNITQKNCLLQPYLFATFCLQQRVGNGGADPERVWWERLDRGVRKCLATQEGRVELYWCGLFSLSEAIQSWGEAHPRAYKSRSPSWDSVCDSRFPGDSWWQSSVDNLAWVWLSCPSDEFVRGFAVFH